MLFRSAAPGGVYSTMDKVTYSSDTRSTLPSTGSLSVARYQLAAASSSTAGYFGGGNTPSPGNYSTMDKVTYSSDTRSTLPSTGALSVSRYLLAATSSSTAGYFGGGSGPVSTMDKVDYTSDTRTAVPGAALSAARYGLAASSARGNSLPIPATATVKIGRAHV